MLLEKELRVLNFDLQVAKREGTVRHSRPESSF